jgi:hypothetical protein
MLAAALLLPLCNMQVVDWMHKDVALSPERLAQLPPLYLITQHITEEELRQLYKVRLHSD